MKTKDGLLKTEDILLKTKDGSSVNRKLLTHILTNVTTHPPQTSELDAYNKLSLWLSLKRQYFPFLGQICCASKPMLA